MSKFEPEYFHILVKRGTMKRFKPVGRGTCVGAWNLANATSDAALYEWHKVDTVKKFLIREGFQCKVRKANNPANRPF